MIGRGTRRVGCAMGVLVVWAADAHANGWKTSVTFESRTLSAGPLYDGFATRQGAALKHPPSTLWKKPRTVETGVASYYWLPQTTASGEKFDKRQMTAAHRTLPLGTRVRVTDVASQRSVVVRINDRGPYIKGRVIDLSEAAAESLGFTARGLTEVQLDVVD